MTKYAEYRNLEDVIEKEWGVEDTTSIFGLQAYYLKTEEMEEAESNPVKGTRHPSTRAERRKATAHKKNRDRNLKRNLGYSERWVNDPSFRHSTYSSDPFRGSERMKEKKVLQNWRAEYEDANVFVRNASTWRWWEDDSSFLYNLRVWEEDEALWEEAWSERAEEEYWEAVEAEEWEEMRTHSEIAYYAEEIEVEELPDDGEEWTEVEPDDLSSVEVCGLERDDDLSSVGCPEPDFAVTCDGMTFTADSEKGAAWLYDRLFAFYGDRVKFDVIFSPVVPSKWDCVYTIMVEGHTFTVVGDEGFRWLHRKLRAFYDVEFNLHIVY